MQTITPHRRPAMLIAIVPLTVFLMTGCDGNERVAEVAREAADRQAEQNRQIAHQNHQVAETTKELVEADANSRRDLIAVQHDLQGQQAEVAKQRDGLEAERRQIAQTRLSESLLAPLMECTAVALVCVMAIALCGFLLYGLRHDHGSDQEITELLVEDMVSEHPLVLPSVSVSVITGHRATLSAIPDDREASADRHT